MSVNLIGENKMLRVRVSAEDLDDLSSNTNFEALGDGVLLVDVVQLENSSSSVAGKVIEALPENYNDLVYITYY